MASLDLPPGDYTAGGAGWLRRGTPPVVAWTYKDPLGLNGPVKAAVVKRSRNGTFLLKVIAKGSLGSGPEPRLTVVPPAPGTDGGVRLVMTAGDRYCVAFGGAAGGAITNAPASGSADRMFKIVGTATAPTAEAGCPVAATSTSTSTSSSTSTSTSTSSLTSTTSTSSSTSTTATFPPGCLAISGRFCDLGDGTVFDAIGLRWEKKTTAVGSGANPADLHDVDNVYTWTGCCGACSPSDYRVCQPSAAAETACRTYTPPAAWQLGGCNQCPVGQQCQIDPNMTGDAITTVWEWTTQVNAEHFAGFNDWRIARMAGVPGFPSGDPGELESIADASFGTPTIDPIFGPTALDYYWSASTLSPSIDDAWHVQFTNGQVNGGQKTRIERVRAVR